MHFKLRNLKIIRLFHFGDNVLISTLITTVEHHKAETLCIMDSAFTKTSTVRPHFSPTTPNLQNIQSSCSGQNNIITSEITNPLLLQNCN